MRKMKLNKALFKGKVILFLLLIYGTSFGQITWNSMVAANISTICSDGEPLLIDFSTTLTGNIDVEIQLGTGMEYLPSSLVLTGASLVTDNTIDSNNPKFTLNLSSGAVSLSFDRIGGCVSRDYQIAGGLFSDVAAVFQSGVQEGTNRTSNNYQIQYASLSITALSNSPATTSVGATVTRSMTINNGSFGAVSEFTFAEVLTPGDLSFSNFVINPLGVNYAIPAGDINLSSGGDSMIVTLDQTTLSNITNTGSDPSLFEQGETFVLQYDVIVTACIVGTNLTSNPTVYWGCDSELCQSYEETSTIAVLVAQPSLNLQGISETTDQCYGFANGTHQYTAMFINEGTGAALISSTKVDFVRPYMGYDPDDVVYSINSGADIAIVGTEDLVGTSPASCLSGVGANLVSRQTFTNLPLIPAGDTLKMKFNIYECCPSECNPTGSRSYLVWGIMEIHNLTFTDACGDNSQYVNRKRVTGNLVTNFIQNYSVPVNMISGDPASNVILDFSQFFWSYGTAVNLDNGYIEMVVNFPGQIDFGGIDVSEISSIDDNGNIHTPSFSDIQDNTMTIRWDDMYDPSRAGQLIFPIITDCSEIATDNVLDYHLYLVPNTGCVEDCKVEMGCFSENLNILCGDDPCTDGGISNVSYAFERKNIGAYDMDNNGCPDTDNNCDGIAGGGTTAPAANEAYIRKDRALHGDTIISSVVGLVRTGVTNPDWEYVYYENNFSDVNQFNFIEATFEIYDMSALLSYSIPAGILSPTIVGNQVKFDLSVVNLSAYLPLGFKYEADDTLSLDILYQVNTTNVAATLVTTDNQFYTAATADPGSINGFECNHLGGAVNTIALDLGHRYDGIEFPNCNEKNITNFIYARISGTWQGQQFFGYEYRNLYKPTAFSCEIPDGYIFSYAEFTTERATSNGSYLTQTYETVVPTSIVTGVGYETYTFDLTDPSNNHIFTENGGSIFLSDEGHIIRPKVYVLPTCGENSTLSKTETLDYTTNVGTTLTASRTANLVNVLPGLSVSSSTPIQSINEDEVTWDVNITNLSTSEATDNNWIFLNAPSGAIGSNTLIVKEGATTLTANANGFYELGSFSSSQLRSFSVTADLQNCDLDTMYFQVGYSCAAYPVSIADYYCTPLEQILEVEPSPSQVSTTITSLLSTPSDPSDASSLAWGKSTVDMCVAFPVEIRIISSQPSELTNLITKLNNLIAGGGTGLDFVSNSAYIEYPVGTAPRAFSTAANTALLAEIGAAQYSFDLATIDPTNFDWTSSTGLVPGVGDAPNNEIILRFEMTTNCDLLSGDAMTFSTFADRPCGEPAIGNGELVSAYDIKIDGVVEPYNINFLTLSVDDLEGCSTQSTINTSYEKTGTATVSSTDSLQFILPEGVTFAGPVNCVSGICPTGSPVVTTVAGLQKIAWGFPVLLNGEGGAFNFTVDYGGSLICGTDIKEVQVSGVSNQSLTCGASSCPSSKVSLGQNSDQLSYLKPDLAVAYNSLTKIPGAPNQFNFDITVENNGALATSDPVVIDFYAYDLATETIIGSRLGRISSSALLSDGGFEDITGSFATLEELPDGVVALIDRLESENCSCPDLDGINNSPFAVSSAVTLPVELSMFRGELIECQVQLSWRSETEEAFSHYELEKSSDGRVFEMIEMIEGSGELTLSQTYQYLDESTFAKNYYRLRMVDLDGSITYSEVLFIETDCAAPELMIHPNPTTKTLGVIDINFTTDRNEEELEIISATRMIVRRVSFQVEPNRMHTVRMPIDDLPSGMYYLRVVGTRVTKMFVVQE